MNLGQRFFYYLGGFFIGLILLFFFLGGKNTSCDYGPNARVLKNIKIKEREYTQKVLQNMTTYDIDTSAISTILNIGRVNFSKSNTSLDSCKSYVIEGEVKENTIELVVKNCDSIARFEKLIFMDTN